MQNVYQFAVNRLVVLDFRFVSVRVFQIIGVTESVFNVETFEVSRPTFVNPHIGFIGGGLLKSIVSASISPSASSSSSSSPSSLDLISSSKGAFRFRLFDGAGEYAAGDGLGAEESTKLVDAADFFSTEDERDEFVAFPAFSKPVFLFRGTFGRGHSISLVNTILDPDTHSSSRLSVLA